MAAAQINQVEADDESGKLDRNFAHAFHALVRRLGKEDLFCERVGGECDGAPSGLDDQRIAEALTEFAGDFPWPSPSEKWSHYGVQVLIEFFFKIASQPSDGHFHQFCGSMHWGKFDSGKGRYAYTVEVNRLLTHHKKRFTLSRGKLVRAGDPVLDDRVRGLKLPDNDLHLRKLSYPERFKQTALQLRKGSIYKIEGKLKHSSTLLAMQSHRHKQARLKR